MYSKQRTDKSTVRCKTSFPNGIGGTPELYWNQWPHTAQPAIACSKLTIATLEQGVKYVQS